MLFLLLHASGARGEELSDPLTKGRVFLDMRLRFENVDQGGFSKNAEAATIRERLGYETPEFWNLKALIELEATQHLSNAFNDTINGRVSYPTVPDPENFELNRLQIVYTAKPGLTATVGRQVINLDDQRFVGAVAFRQNEQTFDAVRLDYSEISGLTATYAYIDRVNRVFGERSPAGHFDGNIHLFNLGYDISDIGKLTAYTYLLDLDQSPLLSTATYGLQIGGAHKLSDNLKLRYLIGYARQQDYADNPLKFSLDYWRAEAGIDYDAWSLTLGSESLGGNGTIGFSTPLATLHPFQGYADVFLNTPARGIADRYARLGYRMSIEAFGASRALSAAVWYHDFEASHGSGDLGHELDFESSAKIDEHWKIDFAYATYSGVAGFADRNKVWLSLTVSY